MGKGALVTVHLMEDYLVTRKIGGGAQGSVFEVLKKENGHRYALKVIYCVGEKQVNVALKEVKFLLALRHPSIVSYVDFFLRLDVKVLRNTLKTPVEEGNFGVGEDSIFPMLDATNNSAESHVHSSNEAHSSTPPRCTSSSSLHQGAEVGVCLIMELCRNGDLQSAISKMREQFMETGHHSQCELTIISWLAQIAFALKHIHAKGIIHRDVKPLNLFFDVQGNIKLGDFGVASSISVGCQSAVGTPDYLAPERLLHQVYDDKVDIWGLGMVALEIITLANHPINSRVLENPDAAEAVVPMVVKMGFSLLLGNVIKSMLQRNSSDRPTSAVILELLCSYRSSLNSLLPLGLNQRGTTSVEHRLCSLCEVEPCVISCDDCNDAFCSVCSITRHKHPSRKDHKRRKLTFSLPFVETSSCSNEIVLTTLGSSRMVDDIQSISENKALACHALRVPEDCDNLSAALEIAANTPVGIIYVSTGYTCKTPLHLGHSIFSLTIIGDSPPPIIDVDDQPVAVYLEAGSGSMSNFIIHHSGKRECAAERSKANSKDSSKPPRPTAFRASGGNWEIHNCMISCKEGSGMLITNAAEYNEDQEENPNTISLTVDGCTFSDILTAGIIFSPSTGGVIKNTTFLRCGYAALVLHNGAHPQLLYNYMLHGCENGIICKNANGVFEGNDISHNENCGVLLKGSHEASMFSKNIISKNNVGVLVADNSWATVCENKIVGNATAGIVVTGKACPIVKWNIIGSGRGAGVYILDEGKGFFRGNHIHGNAGAGFLVRTKGCPEAIENRITNNLEGIWVVNDGCGSFCRNKFFGNQNGSKVVHKDSNIFWKENTE